MRDLEPMVIAVDSPGIKVHKAVLSLEMTASRSQSI